MYEVGRPQRLSVEEAQAKERVWQDFGARRVGVRIRDGAAAGARRACPLALPACLASGYARPTPPPALTHPSHPQRAGLTAGCGAAGGATRAR